MAKCAAAAHAARWRPGTMKMATDRGDPLRCVKGPPPTWGQSPFPPERRRRKGTVPQRHHHLRQPASADLRSSRAMPPSAAPGDDGDARRAMQSNRRKSPVFRTHPDSRLTRTPRRPRRRQCQRPTAPCHSSRRGGGGPRLRQRRPGSGGPRVAGCGAPVYLTEASRPFNGRRRCHSPPSRRS